MSSRAKQFIDPIRYDRRFSAVARHLARPLVAAGRQAERKVWINGGTVQYDGLTLTFPNDVGVYLLTNVYWRGINGYEPEVWRTIKGLLPEDGLFVDVGANVGFYSTLAQLVHPACEVWACEPVPALQAATEALADRNGVQVKLIAAALSDRDGDVDLFLPRQTADVASNASMRADSWQATQADAVRLRVPARSLDSLCRDAGRYPSLVKVDVEEAERHVLVGMTEVMELSRPSVVCEVLPVNYDDHSETFEIIASRGYFVYAITPAGLFAVDRFYPHRSFWNFLLSPKYRGSYIHFDDLMPEPATTTI